MIANAGVAVNRVLHESASIRSMDRNDANVCSSAPTSEFDRMFDINVKGTFFSYKYAAIQLLKQGTGGRMIGAASVASKRGSLAGSLLARRTADSFL